jgi:hypothetical protein
MNHVVTETSPGELGVGCSCGKRFPTRNAAELHASDQNLIEKNEAKAKKSDKAEAHAAELAKQPKEPTEPEKEPEDESDSTPDPAPDEKPQPPAVQPSATSTSSETPQALSPSNLPLDLENLSLNQINFIGQTMAKSGMFPDVTDGAKALVKSPRRQRDWRYAIPSHDEYSHHPGQGHDGRQPHSRQGERLRQIRLPGNGSDERDLFHPVQAARLARRGWLG